MQRAYEQQLFLIEQAITIEREVLVEHNNKRWEALYKQRDKEEVAHLEYKFEQVSDQRITRTQRANCLHNKDVILYMHEGRLLLTYLN